MLFVCDWMRIPYNLRMSNSLEEYDDSQIAIRIAFRAAVVATILYTLLFIAGGVFPKIGQIDYLEPILKVLFVVIALRTTTGYLAHAKKLPNNQSVPFLSTVFFYGIMLLLVYLAQIGYLILQTTMGNPSSFLSKLEFLLGIR